MDFRTALELRPDGFIHERQVVVQICHDPERTNEKQKNNQHAECKGQDIVDTVWGRRDVQEKHEMNAHLRDCENN
jgi:hypothetical protein